MPCGSSGSTCPCWHIAGQADVMKISRHCSRRAKPTSAIIFSRKWTSATEISAALLKHWAWSAVICTAKCARWASACVNRNERMRTRILKGDATRPLPCFAVARRKTFSRRSRFAGARLSCRRQQSSVCCESSRRISLGCRWEPVSRLFRLVGADDSGPCLFSGGGGHPESGGGQCELWSVYSGGGGPGGDRCPGFSFD